MHRLLELNVVPREQGGITMRCKDGPDVFEFLAEECPEPGPREERLRMEAAGVPSSRHWSVEGH